MAESDLNETHSSQEGSATISSQEGDEDDQPQSATIISQEGDQPQDDQPEGAPKKAMKTIKTMKAIKAMKFTDLLLQNQSALLPHKL